MKKPSQLKCSSSNSRVVLDQSFGGNKSLFSTMNGGMTASMGNKDISWLKAKL